MDANKNLLFVGSTHNNGSQYLLDTISDLGWSIKQVDTVANAQTHLTDEQPVNVGIIVLGNACLSDSSEIENLINNTHTEWIALVEREMMHDSQLSQLISRGFFAYHYMPGEADRLESLICHASSMARLVRKHAHSPRGSRRSQQQDEYEMVGTTAGMQNLFWTIRKVASVDTPVLISGESGTGKELAARAIHERSRRADGPFNAVNCAALPDNLIQSELFGHEKGAFTGAAGRKIGRIEASANGVIFLDEIGDLSLDAQVNLLRFLQNHRIQRLGGLDEINVDVRVIAATHVNLEQAVREQRFREDLYHRLNVLRVDIPPLRERGEDIELLAQFFFERFTDEKNPQIRGFSQDTLKLMRQYEWPGNVRELVNRIRRAMVMCESRLIQPIDLGLERRTDQRNIRSLETAREQAEASVIVSALKRNRYRVRHAADDLGVSRVTLYRLMDKYDIQARNTHSCS